MFRHAAHSLAHGGILPDPPAAADSLKREKLSCDGNRAAPDTQHSHTFLDFLMNIQVHRNLLDSIIYIFWIF